MSEVETFFRHCPQCGRRFHIRLVSKNLVDARTEQERGPPAGFIDAFPRGAPTAVTEGPPITIDIEDFRYSYKCQHCGHQWAEIRTEDHQVK